MEFWSNLIFMNQLDLNKLKMILPSSPGIMGKEEYFNAAVLIPFIKVNDEYHLLFEKRAAKIRKEVKSVSPAVSLKKILMWIISRLPCVKHLKNLA